MNGHERGAKIGVVGCGAVGSTFAYTALLRGIAGELVLIDANADKARGDALDMSHGAPFLPATRVAAGDYPDLAGSQIVVVAAGANQRPGETRLDLLRRNSQVMAEIVPKIARHAPDAILLMATNPVDILAYQAFKLSGFPVRRVIGSGTLLDSARFRYAIGQQLGINSHNIHAYMIGEHGDTELPVWSATTVAGLRLGEQRPVGLTTAEREEVTRQTRDAAYAIIQAKGASYYAIAIALARICEAILRDERTVLTISTLVPEYGIFMGVPCLVGAAGAGEPLPLALSPEEAQLFARSSQVLQERMREAGIY